MIVHDGINACSNPSGSNLVNATDPEIDVFITGHSHSRYSCVVNDRVVSAVIHVVLGAPQHPWTFWWAPLLGMLLWAPLHFALDALRLRRRT